MNSFILSFRPIICSLLIIAAIEGVVMVTLNPSDVERSNYLAFNYLTPDSTQEFVIYEKIKALGSSNPDIIQVGDSSGYFGVKPDIVTAYLNGLTYVNLSCCIPMGFDGYYNVAEHMFRQNSGIKALVLYMGLANLPQQDLYSGDIKTGPIDTAFNSVWAHFMPPSLALRWQVTESVYNFFGLLRPRAKDIYPTDNDRRLAKSIRENNGWAHEEDVRMDGKLWNEHWNYICNQGAVFRPDDSKFQAKNIWGQTYSLPLAEYKRFAALAKHYNAKFIMMIHPLGCEKGDERFLKARRDEISELKKTYPETIVIPETLFTSFPPEQFSSGSHFRVGYDVLHSHRVGRDLAQALGITPNNPPTVPSSPVAVANSVTPSVWAKVPFKPEVLSGATAVFSSGEGATKILETTAKEKHGVKGSIRGLRPDLPYIFSVVFKPIQDRAILIETRDPAKAGHYGTARCDPGKLESERHMDAVDADMDLLTDGWYRCWVSMNYTQGNADYSIAITKDKKSIYAGDTVAGIILREARIQPGERLVPNRGR